MFTVKNFINGLKKTLIDIQIEVQDNKIILLNLSKTSRFIEDQVPIRDQTIGEIEVAEILQIID